MNYNETVEVIGEDGVSLGRAILRGTGLQRDERWALAVVWLPD